MDHSEVHEGCPSWYKVGKSFSSKLIWMKDLKSVNEPIETGYRLEDEYKWVILRNPQFKEYFPHHDERRYIPPKKYFWEVFHTLEPEAAEEVLDWINNGIKWRWPKEGEWTITVRRDILDEIMKDDSVLPKKWGSWGWTIHMLKDSFQMIYRKRKWYPERDPELYENDQRALHEESKGEQELPREKFDKGLTWIKRAKLDEKGDSDSEFEVQLKKKPTGTKLKQSTLNSSKSRKDAQSSWPNYPMNNSEFTDNLNDEGISDFMDGKSSSNL